jgi:hypothetical protein
MRLWSAKIPFNGFQRIATLLHSNRLTGDAPIFGFLKVVDFKGVRAG